MSNYNDAIPSPYIERKRNKPLTAQQLAFIQHYIETNNVQKAVELAGYSKSRNSITGYKLLRNPLIAEALKQYKSEIAHKIVCTFEDKAKLLWDIAQRCANPVQTIINGKPTEVDRAPTAIKAIEVLNEMQGHVAPDQSVNINVSATIKKLREIQIEYEDH